MSLNESHIRALRPDALGPTDIEAKAETVAEGKVAMPFPQLMVAAMLAGMFIAFGAMFFCTFLGDTIMPFAVQRLFGGVCFCLGLTLVLCCGAELFTGSMLMVCGAASKKIAFGAMLKNWGLVWIGNLMGSLLVVFLVFMSHLADMNSGGVGTAMISVALGKVTPDWITLFFKGILCNILVCLAVWIGFSARTVVDKIAGLLLPITAFVACGFEHCVANMFFLPMAFVLKITGFSTALDATGLDIGSILYNLSAATLGNIVGGAVFVGLAYWFAYRSRSPKNTVAMQQEAREQ